MNGTAVLSLTFLGVILLVCEASSDEFVETRDSKFVLNGSSFLFNGFNAYWMMQVAADASQRHTVSDVFLEASAASLRVCRIWAFSDGVGDRSLQKSPGVFDERFFQVVLDMVTFLHVMTRNYIKLLGTSYVSGMRFAAPKRNSCRSLLLLYFFFKRLFFLKWI